MPARHTPNTYLEQMQEIPPYLCASLARKGRRAITQQELSEATGWSLSKVSTFCNLESFADVTVADADRFRIACGITRAGERRARFFLRRSLDITKTTNGFNHLRKRGGRLPKFLATLTQNSVEKVS
jgi:hypothetical protein